MSRTDARDQGVLDFVNQRQIPEILHFTMKSGLLGILASGGVLSRDQLEIDEYVQYVYKANCRDRLKDKDWVGYVNLSISRINRRMLNVSEGWPDRDGQWWTVLSFDPVMLSDPGVWFTTTNNTYPPCRRAEGLTGLEDLFAPRIPWGYRGSYCQRDSQTLAHYTTDPQAEVLYPSKVPLEYLRAIYVKTGEHVDEIEAIRSGLGVARHAAVTIKPEVFQ